MADSSTLVKGAAGALIAAGLVGARVCAKSGDDLLRAGAHIGDEVVEGASHMGRAAGSHADDVGRAAGDVGHIADGEE